MQNFIQAIKPLGILLFWFGLAFAICFYVAHFMFVQSIVLAVIAIMARDGYTVATKVAEHVPPKFEPFWVRIMPNWYEISKEYGLYDVTKWDELLKYCGENPVEYSILRNGFNFTRLSGTLFFSNDHQSFFGELDFKIPVEEFLPDKKEKSFGGPYAPGLYIKRTVAGLDRRVPVIEFGLVTDESLKKSHHPTDDRDEIPVAQLPEALFLCYMNPLFFTYDNAKEIEEKADALLKEFEWKRRERDPEDSWLKWPCEVNHRMFQVTYRGLSD
jgi:hypothetical protein